MRLHPAFRRIIWPLLGISILLGLAWMALLSSAFLGLVLESSLRGSTGTEARVTRAQWNGWNTLSVERVEIRAEGWPGQAGALAVVEGFMAEFEPWHLLIGRLTLPVLRVERATLNVAQRDLPGGEPEFNLASIRPPAGGLGLKFSIHPRQIRIGRLDVNNLLVSDEGITVEGSRRFQGGMEAVPNAPAGDLRFELREQAMDAPNIGAEPGGVLMEGTWNERTFAYELTADRLDFAESIEPLLPPAIRQSYRALGVRGGISGLSLRGTPAQLIERAELSLANVAMTLPDVGLDLKWTRYSEGQVMEAYGRPRMDVTRGTLVLTPSEFRLESFKGRLLSVEPASGGQAGSEPGLVAVPLPVELDLALDFRRTPPPDNLEKAGDWINSALTHCGVDLRARIPEYTLLPTAGDRWSAELPRQLVNVLDNFQVRQGRVSIDARLQREGRPAEAEAATERIQASMKIRQGQGQYVNFAYPLHEVDADIDIEDERITVKSLTARGSEECQVTIHGTVDGTDDDAGVDLTIATMTDAPIDLPLQNAFARGPRRIFELLFARDMRERLVQAGLLPEQGSELGGLCRFEIRVRRDRGGGDHIETTGWINVMGGRVLCTRFPYPIDVSTGRIELEDEAIRLPAGTWAFRGAGGGDGTISGEVRIPRVAGGRDTIVDLRLAVVDDRITPLLLAAIPLQAGEMTPGDRDRWPGLVRSEAASAFEAIGLGGLISVNGRIGSDPSGETTLDMNLFLADGTCTPPPGQRDLLEATGLPWPSGFAMDQVSAVVHLTERWATLRRFTGRVGEGRVTAEGAAALLERHRWLRAQLRDVPMGPWLPSMLPDGVRADALAAWKLAQVRGSFTADLLVSEHPDGSSRRDAVFSTDGVHLVAGGLPMEVRVACGHLRLDGPSLELVDIELECLQEGAPIATLGASGFVALDVDGRADLEMDWSVRGLGSPLLPLVMRGAGLQQVSMIAERWNPAGQAHGHLHVERDPESATRLQWRLEVAEGGAIAADPGGVPLRMELVEGARLLVEPGRVTLENMIPGREQALLGHLPGGTFDLHGSMAIGPSDLADGGSLRFTFDLAPLHESVFGILPDDIASGLRGVSLRASNVRSRDLSVLGWTPAAPSLGVRGSILMEGGSMDTGMKLERIHADFAVQAREDIPWPVQVGLGGGSGTLAIGGRVIEGVNGTLRVSQGASEIRVERVEGSLYGGRVWADARVGPADSGPLRGDRAWRLEAGVAGASVSGLVRGGSPDSAVGQAGLVRGSLSMGGRMGEPATGSGSLQATDASMASLPIGLRLLQASQLMLPLADSLDTATLLFHLRGSQLTFDRFDLTCPTLKLLGTGTMDLDAWTVALRFRNRGVVPLLSDLFGAASDQLFVIDVTGPTTSPEVQLTPLPPLGQHPTLPVAHAPRMNEP